ncbi:hypothetical protein SDC9_145753 [bioreactor metagenome]|uniref:Uncharacterized protein n=1 Tax=bioreactor metagenome TaxID=1076179 RepID=A0A645EAS8_9ZZZZ
MRARAAAIKRVARVVHDGVDRLHGRVGAVGCAEFGAGAKGHQQSADVGVHAQCRCGGDGLRLAAVGGGEQRRALQCHAPLLV